MNRRINQPREGQHASHEASVHAAQEVEELDDASVRVLERLRQLTRVTLMSGGLPAVLALQSTKQARVRQETVALDVQALAASALDRETGDHTQRIMWLAEAIAYRLAQSEEEIHLLRLAALLHDIGKVGIPAVILLKPGPLTLEEWYLMHHHPDIGRQILELSGDLFHPLGSIVVAHHERWDGRGYPNGIAKDEIPLGARVLAVVDSYDAMTSPRVYKRDPLSNAQARAELEQCAESQFDPGVVEAFLQVLDEQEKALCSPPGARVPLSRLELVPHALNASSRRRC
jgi:HD-GYP domain-containing protein (c-di-GMP phosphodiesterase class II)